MAQKSGRCRCGAVGYSYTGNEIWCCHCHCESCRRTTSSPFTTFISVAKDTIVFHGVPAKIFNSSPGVARSFCPTCGSPISYESETYPGEIHLYAATLDDPCSIAPQSHDFSSEMLPWIHLNDGLPLR